MLMWNKVIISLIFIGISNGLYAQFILPNYQVQKQKDNTWHIRWEPRSMVEWENSLSEGYQIEIYEGEQRVKSALIKPLTTGEWDTVINNIQDTFLLDFYKGARDLIYMEDAAKEGMKEVLVPEKGLSQDENIKEFQLSFLTYCGTYNYDIAEKSGLAYHFEIEPNKKYRVKVSTGNFEAYEFLLEDNTANLVETPKLQAEFGNRQVELKWKTTEHKDHFFGYFVEVSKNGGRNYNYIQKIPYINVNDTIQGDPELAFLKTVLELDKNYLDYFYRLRGMDYFGFPSEKYSLIKGYGYEAISIPPIITRADQTEDNHAYLRWEIEPTTTRLIEALQIQRADSLEGEFIPVGDNLSITTRDTSILMDTTSNFFRVAILPKDGKEVVSTTVFIMGQDTIPPIVPIGLTGEVDSLGIVTLNWEANIEEDLWGYKVFTSDFLEAEFSNLTSSPITTTIFKDTINLKTNVEEVHYKIQAADTRNNRSAFTTILTLKRPDIIPPITPVITQVRYVEDSARVEVAWDNSGSEDLLSQQLFRKNLTLNEPNWTLLATYDTTNLATLYYDTDYIEGNEYAYILTAQDDDGLTSPPSSPLTTKVVNRKARNIFENISVNIDEETGEATISWQLIDPENVEEIIIYRGKTESDIALYKIVEPEPNEWVEANIKKGKPMYFYLNPIIKEGPSATFSELIIVERTN